MTTQQAVTSTVQADHAPGPEVGRGVARAISSTVLAQDLRGGRAIVLLSGPPCAGKTTYARDHAEEGDRILDWDVLYAEVTGGRRLYDQPPRYAREVSAEFQRRSAAIRRGWIIRSAPRYVERAAIVRLHGARSIVLAVDPLECATRLARSGRPGPVQLRQRPYIYAWWWQFTYQASPDEVVLRPDPLDVGAPPTARQRRPSSLRTTCGGKTGEPSATGIGASR